MWLITTIGFFSVVQKPGDTDLTVRARVRADLEALREYMPELTPIVHTPHSDYKYRARISHAAFGRGLARLGEKIDYDNFKSRVSVIQGHKRASIYARVWEDLMELRRLDDGTEHPG